MRRLRAAAVIAAAPLLLGAPAARAVDRTPPQLALAGTLVGADGAVVESGVLTVDPAASDPSGVASLTLTVDGRRVAGSPPWRIVTRAYGEGSHHVVVTASDAAGNVATDMADVRFAHVTPQASERDALRSDAAVTLDGRVAGEAAGSALANVGDVDGDGREDVLVGAPGSGRRGAAWLALGGSPERIVRFRGAWPGDRAGATVAAAGDVDGDGFRDLLIGAPGNGGSVAVVFGGPRLRSLSLRRLGAAGMTIRGLGAVLAGRRLGDFAVDGDVNGDGLDDVAIGDPAAAGGRGVTSVVLGRRYGGRAQPAYRIVGAAPGDGAGAALAFPGDVNHDGRADLLVMAPGAGPDGVAYVVYGGAGANLPALGAGGFRVIGAPGDRLASAGTIGDVDGDSTPDLLLGGRGGVVVFAQPGADVALAAAFPGFRVEPPSADAGPAQVMGAGDVDGDYAPDAAFGFPSVGAAFVVFSPLDEPTVSLASLPGERGARIAGAPGALAGQALDGLDAFGDGVPALLVGAPGALQGAGSVSVIPGSTLAGAQLSPTGCQPNRLWSFPLSREHVLPRCRRATRVVDSPAFNPSPAAGEIARFNPAPACGAPSRTCQPSAYRSGNARLHGPAVGLTTDAPVDLVDSYGDRLAAIQRTVDPACFAVFDRALQRVGATCDPTGQPPAPHPMELWVQGRACMASDALEDRYYLVRLLDAGSRFGAAYRELQGFVRRDQISLGEEQTTVGGATYSPQELAEAAYSGCGPRPPKRRPVPVGFRPTVPGLPTGERLFGFTDRYVSNASFASCEERTPPIFNPTCYGPYSNYQVPTLASKEPQRPTGDAREGADWAALTVSSTGVSGAGYPAHPQDAQQLAAAGGGLVRAIIPRDRPFTVLDGFDYADPNVLCDTPRIARWTYGYSRPGPGEHPIFGWTVFRDPQAPRERNGLSTGCP